MRVCDDAGEWKVSDRDPRAMVFRRANDFGGKYYRVFQEGFIRGYDGLSVKAAPPKWGLDFNRNFPADWGIESRQPGAGKYPLSEPETRAVAEFIIGHPNISIGVTNHTSGGALLVLPGTRPVTPKNDLAAAVELSKIGTQLTGFPCVSLSGEFHVDKDKANLGAFDSWLYYNNGILSYTPELWNLAERAGVKLWPRVKKSLDELEDDLIKMLAWNDRELEGEAFMDWRPFVHPQIGRVEIGGWNVKHSIQNAPVRFLPAECYKMSQWFVALGRALPQIEIRGAQSKKVAEGLYEVKCAVMSAGYLSTSGTELARDIKMQLPFQVTLSGDVEPIGKAKHEIQHLAGRAMSVSDLPPGYFRVPATSREAVVRWLVRAEPGHKAVITASTPRAGTAAFTLAMPC